MLFTTAFIVYALPVAGLVYAEQIRGPGWRSSLRRSWQAGLALMAIFIAYDVVNGRPYASLAAYRFFVIAVMVVLLPHVVLWRHRDRVETIARTIGTASLALAVLHDNLMGFRLLPWRVSVEVYGLSAFLLSLGVVTVRRFFADQRELAVVESEMATARSIQASILPDAAPAVANFEIAARFVPARWVGGDLTIFCPLTGGASPSWLPTSRARVCRRRYRFDGQGRVFIADRPRARAGPSVDGNESRAERPLRSAVRDGRVCLP